MGCFIQFLPSEECRVTYHVVYFYVWSLAHTEYSLIETTKIQEYVLLPHFLVKQAIDMYCQFYVIC